MLNEIFQLRPATAEDDVFLRALFAQTRPMFQVLPAAMAASLSEMQFRARAQGYAEDFPNLETWVITKGCGELVGSLMVAETDEMLRIVDIAVLPKQQRQGAGSFAVKAALERAGDKEVCLSVQRGNPAERLYRGLGFYTMRENELDLEMSNGDGLHCRGESVSAQEIAATRP